MSTTQQMPTVEQLKQLSVSSDGYNKIWSLIKNLSAEEMMEILGPNPQSPMTVRAIVNLAAGTFHPFKTKKMSGPYLYLMDIAETYRDSKTGENVLEPCKMDAVAIRRYSGLSRVEIEKRWPFVFEAGRCLRTDR